MEYRARSEGKFIYTGTLSCEPGVDQTVRTRVVTAMTGGPVIQIAAETADGTLPLVSFNMAKNQITSHVDNIEQLVRGVKRKAEDMAEGAPKEKKPKKTAAPPPTAKAEEAEETGTKKKRKPRPPLTEQQKKEAAAKRAANKEAAAEKVKADVAAMAKAYSGANDAAL